MMPFAIDPAPVHVFKRFLVSPRVARVANRLEERLNAIHSIGPIRGGGLQMFEEPGIARLPCLCRAFLQPFSEVFSDQRMRVQCMTGKKRLEGGIEEPRLTEFASEL